MDFDEIRQQAEVIYQDLRLSTLPVATRFLKGEPDWPEKTRRPAEALGKRITVCQGMTLARLYRWTVGMTAEDLICAPAMLLFGLTRAEQPAETLANFFSRVGWSADLDSARHEMTQLRFLPKGQISGLLMAPLSKGLFEPDVITIYGNPAQMMRIAQAWSYMEGAVTEGATLGRASCSEYMISPYLNGKGRLCLPGNGDRVMSMTQDHEMAFALPGSDLGKLAEGLQTAGVKVGARYPVPFYLKYQPEFPKPVMDLIASVEP